MTGKKKFKVQQMKFFGMDVSNPKETNVGKSPWYKLPERKGWKESVRYAGHQVT